MMKDVKLVIEMLNAGIEECDMLLDSDLPAKDKKNCEVRKRTFQEIKTNITQPDWED